MIKLDYVLLLHKESIEDFGGSLGIRDIGYLQSAIERPFSTFGGKELYTSPFQKAAAILESIVKNHPFVDGNKRTGFLACASMLLLYDLELVVEETQSYSFIIAVASTQMDFENIVEWIQMHSISIV